MAKKKNKAMPLQATKLVADQAAVIVRWTSQVLAVAEQLKIKNKSVVQFVPGKMERTVLSALRTVTPNIRKRMSQGDTDFNAAEVAGMAIAVAEDLPNATPQEQVGLLTVAKNLMNALQQWITEAGEAKLTGKK